MASAIPPTYLFVARVNHDTDLGGFFAVGMAFAFDSVTRPVMSLVMSRGSSSWHMLE